MVDVSGIFNTIKDTVFSPLGAVLSGAAGAALGLVLSPIVSKFIGDFRDKQVSLLASKIDQQSPEFQTLVKHLTEDLIALADKQFPNQAGDKKLDGVIKTLQDVVPNWLLSDDAVKEFVQKTFDDVKKKLSEG